MKTKHAKVVVENLSKSYGSLLVLDDISFTVGDGEFLCIVGPTGCGKTTFLNSLTKIVPINSGTIRIDGEPVDPKKHNLAYILQEYSALPWLTVEKNIAYGLKIKGFDKAVIKERVAEAIALVNLEKFKHFYPSELSASMLQRVVIARAFATQPDLLLMDEPYGQLDLNLKYKLEDELLKLWEKTRTTIIFITHNIEEAVYLSDRILIMTNKPSGVKTELINDLPRPRRVSDPKFIELRNQVTDLIKWW
ncbi:MAG TPA: ABC transporter ATP-binding protein [Sphaerochaeta sp.]|nr:ABC transporter ATP-binding protein [Sphaerochaeta sp.]